MRSISRNARLKAVFRSCSVCKCTSVGSSLSGSAQYQRIFQDQQSMGPPAVKSSGGLCSICIRMAKWIPVIFIMCVLGWSYYAFVVQLCLFTIEELWFKIFALCIYHVSLIMFLWAYWRTILTSSGRISRKFKISPVDMERIETVTSDAEVNAILENIVRVQQLPVQTRTNNRLIRYCEKCQMIKPDRTHHCSVCGDCILKMDHHCPWVNNCVCFNNYKFFILFLGYSFLYCFVIFCISLRYFIGFWKEGWEEPMQGRFHVIFVFFVAAMFAVSLVSLFSYHIFLVSKNRSTLESFRSPIFAHGVDKKGFNLGVYNNFVEVFGDDPKLWLLPIFSSLGDGISYPTRHGWNAFNNGTYNALDTTESTPVAGTPPDRCIEVKVETRAELANRQASTDNANGNVVELSAHGQGHDPPLVYF